MFHEKTLYHITNALTIYVDMLKSNKATDPYDLTMAERSLADMQALADGTQIASVWGIDDVYSVAQEREYGDVTEEQAKEVLRQVERNHDANYGINWDTLADTLYTILEDAKEKK